MDEEKHDAEKKAYATHNDIGDSQERVFAAQLRGCW